MKDVSQDFTDWEKASTLERTFRKMIQDGLEKQAFDLIKRLFPNASDPKVVLMRAKYRAIGIEELRKKNETIKD